LRFAGNTGISSKAGAFMTARHNKQKTVVVHRGARDAYQVAAALAEAGLLECLVTDLYWPNDRPWAAQMASRASAAVRSMLLARYSKLLPSQLVTQTLVSGVISQVLDMWRHSPFAWRRRATRWTDAAMGRKAGTRARQTNSALLSYSYYGYQAFSSYGKPGLLFQAHPHPASVRRILMRELEAHPECAPSLRKEWELSLPQEDFERLVAETQMAAHTLAASSFTRQTLVENGVAVESVSVIPYGVDLERFSPAPSGYRPATDGPLKLLFVGIINQRKGIKYLLEALRLVSSRQVELTVCGRVVDDLALFRPFASQVKIRPSVSATELLQAYRSADLFVFPSVVEGFGQVLLESLACGLPVLSTTRTAAPDLVREGIEGFIVEPCRPDQLAHRIDWALAHREQLSDMRAAACARAAHFSWSSFRHGVVDAVCKVNRWQPAEFVEDRQYV
jgi:glycosyltransferase involved in cell wall biosynthesis